MTETSTMTAQEMADRIAELEATNGSMQAVLDMFRETGRMGAPNGWRFIPEQPTEEMLFALGFGYPDDKVECLKKWQRMLNATPEPPKEPKS